MNIKIQGKGIEVSEYLKETVEKKAKKLDRYFKPQTQMNVMLSIEKLRQIAEVTIICDGLVLRCEEATGDMYASIDASLKKLERQMRKHRTKLERRLHTGAFDEGAVYEQSAWAECRPDIGEDVALALPADAYILGAPF